MRHAIRLLIALIGIGSLNAQVTISFSPPNLLACGNVEIQGGFTAPGLQDVAPYWEWGDGTTSRSFFPAHHRYERDGTFTITGSIRQGSQVLGSRSVIVTISGTTQSACRNVLVVEPFQVLLRDGVTSQQLRVSRIRPDGSRITAEATTLRFRSGNPSIAQVTDSGLVSSSGFGDLTIGVEDRETGRTIQVPVHAGDIRVEPPYARLIPGARPETQLQVLAHNADGTLLNLSGRKVEFRHFPVLTNDPVISISATGLVRGLRLPRSFNETPAIFAYVDGFVSGNNAIIRVAQTLPDLEFVDLTSGSTRFHIARKIGRFDYQSILTQSDVPKWTDLARKWEEFGAGTRVSRGGVRALVNDVGGSPVPKDPTIPCGLSGNPTRLGSDPASEENNSCLIAANPLPVKPYPQWFVYFHEIGHDTTFVSMRFDQIAAGAGEGTFRQAFVEGLASTLSIYAAESVRRGRRQDPLPNEVLREMTATQCFAESPLWVDAVRNYEATGASFAKMNPDVLTGIFAQLMREEGLAWYARMHSGFLPVNTPYDFSIDGETQASTVLVAAVSAAIGRDMRTRFARWGFPLDTGYFDRVYPLMIQLTRQRQPVVETKGVTSAASYSTQPVAPESWVALFGDNMAPRFYQPAGVELELDATTVWVTDGAGRERQAQLQFVSPGHINVLMPSGLAVGEGRVRVSTWLGDASAPLSIRRVAPGLFSANATGRGAAAATWLRIAGNGSRTEGSVVDGAGALAPIDLGGEADQVFVSFFGTGFRNQTSVKVLIDGLDVPVFGAVAQGQFEGLDQVVVGPLPKALSGRGTVSVQATFDGQTANPLTISIR